MDPIGQIAIQPWMETPATKAVIAALMEDGQEARFAGGCVRDSVAHRKVRDVDIATPEPPERVLALLQQAGIRAIPTGIEHGTITAVIGKEHFEITTLRTDIEHFGRRARVAFTDSWEEDASRRDFTINAMFMRTDGVIYDYHNGIRDLSDGIIRFVGNPKQRIEEDVLRLLRFFRFLAHYGRASVHCESLMACRLLAPLLPKLSAERVCGELIRLLYAPDPALVLMLMRGERILEHLLPEAAHFGRLRTLTWLETTAVKMDNLAPDPMRRLGIMLSVDEKGAAEVAERLKLSREEARHMALAACPPFLPDWRMGEKAIRQSLYEHGADDFRNLVLVAWAARKSVEGTSESGESSGWIALLDAANRWIRPDPPIKGRDVLALGLPSGPKVGLLVWELETWWRDNDFRPSREEALVELKNRAKILMEEKI
jgi:poly(A) polymerase